MFGLFHLTNLFNNVPTITVFAQVFYATVIGIAFAAIYLRTNNNLLWCVILHALYDIATEIGDVIASGNNSTGGVVVTGGNTLAETSIETVPYLMEQLLFLPLFIYAWFLLRKVLKVDEKGRLLF